MVRGVYNLEKQFIKKVRASNKNPTGFKWLTIIDWSKIALFNREHSWDQAYGVK